MAINTWNDLIDTEKNKPYFRQLTKLVRQDEKTANVYPPKNERLKALKLTPFSKVSVVILGQDPYHGENQANGLSFAINKGFKNPPSLQNIIKELNDDLGLNLDYRKHVNLENWAKQGVLLLNTTLTVREKEPNSHLNFGWSEFTNKIIEELSKRGGVVFVLWGKNAQNKDELIDTSKNHIIETSHPSPFSARRGFFGSHPFSKINEYLLQMGRPIIHWNDL